MQNSYMLRVQIQDIYFFEEQEHDPYTVLLKSTSKIHIFFSCWDRFLLFLRNQHKILRCR
jgi:hypothetical protein